MGQTGPASLWFAGLLTASVSLLVGNKYIAERYEAHNLTVLFQNALAASILWVGAQLGHFEVKQFQLSQFQTMGIPAVLNSIQLLTSIKALPHVAIATTVVFRNISTLVCATIEMLYFHQNFSWQAKASLVTIFIGSIFYAKEDMTFDMKGYSWLLANTAVYTVNNIYTKLKVTKMEQTGSGVALVTLVLTLPVFLCYAFIWGELPHGIYNAFALRGTTLIVFIFLGFMGTLISMSYNNLYKLVSATSVVVAANMNKIAAIVLAWFVFDKTLSVTQIFGLCVCIAGGISYAIQVKKDKTKSAKSQKPQEMKTLKNPTNDNSGV